MELPELPESDKCFADDEAEAYTEDQMRAYGQACAEAERERCAKVGACFNAFTGAHYCDESGPGYDPRQAHDYGRGGCYVRSQIVAAIRKP